MTPRLFGGVLTGYFAEDGLILLSLSMAKGDSSFNVPAGPGRCPYPERK